MELDGEGENVMRMMRMRMVVCKELCRSGRVKEWKTERKRRGNGRTNAASGKDRTGLAAIFFSPTRSISKPLVDGSDCNAVPAPDQTPT